MHTFNQFCEIEIFMKYLTKLDNFNDTNLLLIIVDFVYLFYSE